MTHYAKDQVARLRLMADVTHGMYPQYSGYFNDWVLAVATRSIKFKGGSVLAEGRMVLASPDLKTFFDPDTGHECSIGERPALRLWN